MSLTPPRASRAYLNLYFSLERPEDLHLLTLLYALPVGQRGSGIKQVLRLGLAAYLQAEHPDRPPLDRQAVRDLVAARAPARHRAHRGGPAHGSSHAPKSPAPPPAPETGAIGVPSPAAGEPADDGNRLPSGDAEVRLDRLLRSFLH